MPLTFLGGTFYSISMLPPAWQTVDNIDPDVRAFYEFFDCQMEPWD